MFLPPSPPPPSPLPRIYLSFSFEWPRPDKQQQTRREQRTRTATTTSLPMMDNSFHWPEEEAKAPDNFQLNDKLCHYLSSSLPPSILLIYFYSGRGTWQSCIEWTLNRLQLNKDRLFVCLSVCPSVCMPEESDTIIDLFPKLFKFLVACLQLRLWTLIATATEFHKKAI